MLTDEIINAAAPADRPYKLWDGKGLFLYVAPTGLRSWRMKYQQAGREKLETLGQHPAIPLVEARRRAGEFKAAMKIGVLPPAALRSQMPHFPSGFDAQIAALLALPADPGSWVYLIRFGAAGAVKVGKSSQPERRFSAMQVAHEEKIQVLALLPGDVMHESVIHMIFADEHRRGEWFSPSDRLLRFAEGVGCH